MFCQIERVFKLSNSGEILSGHVTTKFFRSYGRCQIFVEEIRSDVWHVAIYELGTFCEDHTDGPQMHQHRIWDLFTCITKNVALRSALITVENRFLNRRANLPVLEGEWIDCSEDPARWNADLQKLGFRGYLEVSLPRREVQ
jgi:hypothetical protein